MKLYHYLRPELVLLDLRTTGVEDTLGELVRQLADNGVIKDSDALLKALLEREAVQSTGIGGGLAIPHATFAELESPTIVLGLGPKGVDFDSLDKKPVYTVFLLLSPPVGSGTHIKLLARIARLMRQPGFVDQLLSAETAEEVVGRIRELDEEHP